MPTIKGFKMKNGKLSNETLAQMKEYGVGLPFKATGWSSTKKPIEVK